MAILQYMLFFESQGKLIEILRKNFTSDKQYYNAIIKAYNIELNKQKENNYNYIKNLVTK